VQLQSTTQDQYQSSEQNPLDSTTLARTAQQNEALKEKSRNSNFSLSQSQRPAKFQNETSASHAYTPEKLKLKEHMEVGNARTMRAANFRMGFESAVDYGTTTEQNNAFFREESNRNILHAIHKS